MLKKVLVNIAIMVAPLMVLAALGATNPGIVTSFSPAAPVLPESSPSMASTVMLTPAAKSTIGVVALHVSNSNSSPVDMFVVDTAATPASSPTTIAASTVKFHFTLPAASGGLPSSTGFSFVNGLLPLSTGLTVLCSSTAFPLFTSAGNCQAGGQAFSF